MAAVTMILPTTIKQLLKLFAAITALCLLFACHQPKRIKNEITKIVVATGNCFGPCQRTAVSIDSSLAYHFYGGGLSFSLPRGEDTTVRGYYTGRVSQAFLDTLEAKLIKINYQQLNTLSQEVADAQSVEVIIHYKGSVKHIRADFASIPDSVGQVFRWISKSYKQVKLKPVKDTIRFETSIQLSRWD